MSSETIQGILLVLFGFFIDSVLSFFIPFDYGNLGVTIIPYIGTMFFALVFRQIPKKEHFFFAAIVGLYYAIVYGNSLLIYVLLYIGLTIGMEFYVKRMKMLLLEFVVIVVSTIFSYELVLYLLMWITNRTNVSFIHTVLYRFLPTIGFGIISGVILFVIYKKCGFGDGQNGYYSKGY